MNACAPAFTPTIGRVDPIPLSPPEKTAHSPASKARRDSLLKFVWPPSLVSTIPYNSNKSLFTTEEKTLIKSLCQCGQTHLFDDWDGLGKRDNEKKAFIGQLMKLNSTYPGGLLQYIFTAQKLLSDAAKGVNPLEEWVPEVPVGVSLDPTMPEYADKEALGMPELGSIGFVLVAGGLGERLGYSGIKIGLPCETTTGTTYMELYCQQILAMQTRYCRIGQTLSLAIMVSDDTMTATEELLLSNNNFGLDITVMKQEKVPALIDSNARLALESKYVLDSKPHGHGDVHVLMNSTGTAQQWLDRGLKWVVFFQDTNGLAFNTLAASLGTSVEMNLEVNSITVPRFAKQAVGAIAKLKHKDGKELTVNVEYNQLDPLLRATISPEGDVNDLQTGASIFPGNINQLIFALKPYQANLAKTNGIMGEFVNAKYTDDTKTAFKKPTRLECLMQDYSKVLDGEAASRVGFTQFPAWACYSPCKNNSTDAAASILAGVPAGSAWTAESDQYTCQAQFLRALGCQLAQAPGPTVFLQIPATPGPRILIHPTSALFLSELKSIVPTPGNVTISANSTLVVKGDVVIERLDLDGALTLIAAPGTRLIVNAYGDEGRVANIGHKLVALPAKADNDEDEYSEVARMRGFVIQKQDEKVINTENDLAQLEKETKADIAANGSSAEVFYFSGGKIIQEKYYEAPSAPSVCKRLFSFC